jgi:hypothetical protein
MSLETMTKLATVTVGAGGLASVDFTNIPQTYTDLRVVMSVRSANASNFDNPRISINGSTSGFTRRELYAESGSVGSESVADRIIGNCPAANVTASTFGSLEFYLPNYTSSNYKSWSSDSVTENNSTTISMWLLAGLWSNTTAVSTITVSLQTSSNFAQHSTFTLYGVKAMRQSMPQTARAIGGVITRSGGYTYHTFTSSNMFIPTGPIGNAEVLVVAGGGGGGTEYAGGNRGGGGGAGGLLYFPGQAFTAATTVVVGAGGKGGAYAAGQTAGVGTSSFVGALTVAVGGGNGGAPGATGGSGGGGNPGSAGGSATAGQGNAGGSGQTSAAGGGGGAGAAGTNGVTSVQGGNGGVGLSTYSAWGLATSTGQNVSSTYYYAGGGGGGSAGVSNSGGYGGGGLSEVAGTANTGGGGGGSGSTGSGASGGSGVVIIRYAG